MKVKGYEARLVDGYRLCLKETGRTYEVDGRRSFNNPQDIASFVGREIGLEEAAEEYVYVMCLNNRNRLVGLFEASHGAVNVTLFPVRETLQKALMLGAVSIVIAHNHPGGDATPSKDDISATEKIRNGCDAVGITMLDHIITALKGNYFSFKEGLLC